MSVFDHDVLADDRSLDAIRGERSRRHRRRRPVPPRPRRCRVCGCTDRDCSGCIERTGVPCHWVEIDLCSACVPRAGREETGGAS